MHVLVFDIETIPDVHSGRRLYGLDGYSDQQVAEALWQMRREQTGGSDFLRHHLHQIAAIALVLDTGSSVRVCSIGDLAAKEAEIIQRFFDGISKYQATLVSWNGGGFDLPVLHYRALLHGISAPRYWEIGEADSNFRWNNYLNRYHYRHMDLMDILSCYQSRATAPLDEIALMLGLPGKLGMHGSKVWDSIQQGQLQQVRNYCETDVLNTYLVYLRFEVMRGKLTAAHYQEKCQQLRDWLIAQQQTHFTAFVDAWQWPPSLNAT